MGPSIRLAFWSCMMAATAISTKPVARPPAPGMKAIESPALVDKSGKSAKPINKVQLTVLDFKQLKALLKTQRGHIVVMDIWGQFCQPCRRQFPRLVKLHHDYADQGVICVSVSVDDPDNRDSVLSYLKGKKATFLNFLLDEDASVWQEKWDLSAIPAVFVFGPDGKVAAKFHHNEPNTTFDYDDVEEAVDELLKEGKPDSR